MGVDNRYNTLQKYHLLVGIFFFRWHEWNGGDCGGGQQVATLHCVSLAIFVYRKIVAEKDHLLENHLYLTIRIPF